MPKQKLTDRQFISGVTLSDLLHFVVTGDTSQNPAGSSYKGSVEQLFNTFSSFTCTYPLIVDTVNSCSGSITINGDVTINGSATTINTQIIQSQDNNIVLNYSGTHLTAIGGGITVEDGQSDGVDSSIYTDSNGTWLFNPGLSASTGTINNFTANTISVTTIGDSGDCVNDLYVSNIHSCSPLNINPLDEGNVYFGSNSGVTIDVTNSRIGIGTNSPTEKLDVSGNTKISGTLNIGNILGNSPIINLGLDSNGFVVTGVTTIDTNTFTTGATLNGTIIEFDRNDLSNAYNVDLSSLQFTGNTSGNCVTDLYVSNLYGCSPITINDDIEIVNGKVIKSSSGNSYIDLRAYGVDNEIHISTDGDNYNEAGLFISNAPTPYSTELYNYSGRVVLTGGVSGNSIGHRIILGKDNQTSFEGINIETIAPVGVTESGDIKLSTQAGKIILITDELDLTNVTSIIGLPADANTFTTGATLNGSILEFDRNDLSNAYSVDLSGLTSSFTGQSLSQTLTIGNNTGNNDIIVDNGQVVKSNTDNYLDLQNFNDNKVKLSTSDKQNLILYYESDTGKTSTGSYCLLANDGENFTDAYIYLEEENYGQLARYRLSDGTYYGFNLYGNNTFQNYSTGVSIKDNETNSFTSVNKNNPAVIIGSRNSTINSGITNSVIIGGQNILASENNTVYVDNLNINTLGTGTSVNNLGIDSNGNVVAGTSTTDTNFANTNLTFTGNREHNTNGNSLQITTDGGNFLQGFIFLNTTKSEFGFGSSYTDWRSTSVDHYLSGVKRLEILSSETVLNNTGGDFNFRVEGDTDTHLLFVDAGTDEIGVGTNNPLGKLHIQTTENLPVLVVDGLRGTTTLGKRQHYTAQADTVTVGVGTSNIASIPMVSSERMTLTGKITAFFGDVTVGGTFIAVAKCSSSTVSIVGTVVTSIRSENSAGTPSFTVVGSGSNVVIQVTGGGEDLTWLCTYEYQIVSPPAG
jgi:hypothetical protein